MVAKITDFGERKKRDGAKNRKDGKI